MMKKIINLVLTILGINLHADNKIVRIDPNEVLFSLPTLSFDSLHYTKIIDKNSTKPTIKIHEDDWAQIEFYPINRLEEIKQKLSKYKQFELKNRREFGWEDTYSRIIPRHKFKTNIKTLTNIKTFKRLSPVIATTSSETLGYIKDSFAFDLENKIILYGKSNNSIITVLAMLIDDNDKDFGIDILYKLNKIEPLFLVDWIEQSIVIGDNDSTLKVWTP